MKKVLVAIDGSKSSQRAIEFTGQFFSNSNDISITLFHVLPELPTGLWEEGHILTGDEKTDKKDFCDNWLTNQKLKIEPHFKSAIHYITKSGIDPQKIITKSIPESSGVANAILDEAKNGNYHVIILGRRGLSNLSRFLMGSVTSKVIHHGTGLAICIVE
ncbi:MAG: universal stress protein [Thermodesulfobacteriota bacterium]|nr:universal stress protein [Thermodesulfobacteriota bacterium]